MNSKIWYGIPTVIGGLLLSFMSFWLYKNSKDPEEIVVPVLAIWGVILFGLGWQMIGEGIGIK